MLHSALAWRGAAQWRRRQPSKLPSAYWPASHVPVGNEAPKQPLLSLMSLPLPRSTSMEIAEPLCSSLQSLLVLAWTELLNSEIKMSMDTILMGFINLNPYPTG
jgi:hypothetical protein